LLRAEANAHLECTRNTCGETPQRALSDPLVFCLLVGIDGGSVRDSELVFDSGLSAAEMVPGKISGRTLPVCMAGRDSASSRPMSGFKEAFGAAFGLVIGLDADLLEIVVLSLWLR